MGLLDYPEGIIPRPESEELDYPDVMNPTSELVYLEAITWEARTYLSDLIAVMSLR